MGDFKHKLVGRFYSGKNTAVEGASLEFDGHKFLLQLKDHSTTYTLQETKITSRIGNIPRSFHFADGSSFDTEDNDAVDLIAHELRSVSGALHKLEKNLKLIAFSAAGFLAFLCFLYFIALPFASVKVAKLIPDSYVNKLSQKTYSWVFSREKKEEVEITSEIRSKADLAFTQVKASFPGTPLQIKLINSASFGANAFALPDGTILVTDELVKILEPQEILAVLMHEVGHIKMRHGLSLIIENSILSLMIFAVAGDASNLPLLILSSRYSREFETEADLFAKEHLTLAGISVMKMISALEKLENSHDLDSIRIGFISSHPITKERLRTLQEKQE